MSRYIVERTFTEGLRILVTEAGAQTCLGVVDRNADLGVPWSFSFSARQGTAGAGGESPSASS